MSIFIYYLESDVLMKKKLSVLFYEHSQQVKFNVLSIFTI